MSSTFLIIFSIISGWNCAYAFTAQEIMQKNEDARQVNDFSAFSILETGTNGESANKVKEFTIWRKIQKNQIYYSTLTRFQKPAEVRNEGVMIIENASGRNDVLMYLPTFKKVRRVESQQQSGSFMGSVFSYSDIATPHVADFTYKLLKEEKCISAETFNCFVIECLPASDDIKERTGYSKSTLWVRNDNFMSTHADHYDADGKLFKKLDAKDIKVIDAKNNKWLAHDLNIVNLNTNEFTRLKFSKVKANTGISDAVFTQQNLQKVNE